MATLGALAAKCAAGLSLELLAGIAGVESGVRPLVVRDGAAVIEVKSAGEGVAVAVGLIDRGRDPGIGLMGVTAAMLTAAGVSLAEAFDPCASLRAAEHAFTAAAARAAKRGVEGPSIERAAVQAWWRREREFQTAAQLEQAVRAQAAAAKTLLAKELGSAGARPADVRSVEVRAAAPAREKQAAAVPCWDVFAVMRNGGVCEQGTPVGVSAGGGVGGVARPIVFGK